MSDFDFDFFEEKPAPSRELEREELWRTKYERLKNESDRRIRALVDEADRNLNTIGHQYATIDRLRWALALCKGKMSPEDWDEDVQKYAESR